MKNYRHLSWNDRLTIERMLLKKYPKKAIADAIGCSLGTIYNELARAKYIHTNSDLTNEERYSPDLAEQRYRQMLKKKGKKPLIIQDKKLCQYISYMIKEMKYSPEAILLELNNNKGVSFDIKIKSVNTIYDAIKKGYIPGITMEYLPRRGKKIKRKKSVTTKKAAKVATIGISIEKRPSEINYRETFGHWEMDCVIGKSKNKTTLLVLTERLTRYEIIEKLKAHNTSEVIKALNRIEKRFKSSFYKIFKSITVDNGSEFKESSLHGKDGLRSTLRAEIENSKEDTIEITKLIRDIVADKKERSLLSNDEFAEKMKELYCNLKEKSNGKRAYLNLWAYNTNFMNDFKAKIDDISNDYINKYQEDAYKVLKAKISDKEAAYRESYGGDINYMQNQIKKELYPRLGNAILSELKAYEKIQQDKIREVTYARKLIGKGNIEEGIEALIKQASLGSVPAQNTLGFIYLKGEFVEKNIKVAREYFVKASQEGNDIAKKMIYRIDAGEMTTNHYSNRKSYILSHSSIDFARALSNLKKSMNKTIENYKAQQAYEELQWEIEGRGEEI